ncbi:hypothetical protein J8M20_09045 [Pseudoalteromonas luteoviolacea]|uniref:hypothetical protein n=1 Tax=Pseudoalteromonas luteoviolacea TaxID=43657 RepID=UPI001B371D99|nr:hypothetical protein [Pseudoalteromonas luteoviolacea]MBQ4811483.1 hypothetical protein [Pseudoalteromonas luteoviolacea]
MNINNLNTGYSGYNPLLKSNEEDIEKSKKELASKTEKVSSEPEVAKTEQKTTDKKEDNKSEEAVSKDKKVSNILSLQQRIKALQLEQKKDGVDKSAELTTLQQNLEKELSEIQSLIRSQASTYVSGLFSNAPNSSSTHRGMFFNNRA